MAEKTKTDETVTRSYRIDVKLNGIPKSTYMVVTGIPKDLPPEYDNTIKMSAERQFAEALNTRRFLEFYTLGKSAKDEQPVFINTDHVNEVQITEMVDVSL